MNIIQLEQQQQQLKRKLVDQVAMLTSLAPSFPSSSGQQQQQYQQQHQKSILEWKLEDIGLLVTLLISLLGNGLTLYLVSRRRRLRKSNSAIFIGNMALFDLITLSVKFCSMIAQEYKMNIYNFCIFLHVAQYQALLMSSWMKVLFAAERALAIGFPNLVNKYNNRRACKIVVCLSFLILALLSMSMGVCINYSKETPGVCKIKSDPYGFCSYYLTRVYIWVKLFSASIVPIALNLFLDAFIVYTLITTKSDEDASDDCGFFNKKEPTATNSSPHQQNNQQKQLNFKRSIKRISFNNKRIKQSNEDDENEKTDAVNKSSEVLNGLLKDTVIVAANSYNTTTNVINNSNNNNNTLQVSSAADTEASAEPSGMKFLINRTKFEHEMRSSIKKFNPKSSLRHRLNRSQQASNGSQPNGGVPPFCMRNQKHLTKVLLFTSAIFIILTLPHCVIATLKLKNIIKSRSLHKFGLFVSELAHAVNFIVYILVYRRFRIEFTSLLTENIFTCLQRNSAETDGAETITTKQISSDPSILILRSSSKNKNGNNHTITIKKGQN